MYSGLADASRVMSAEKRVRYVTKISPALQKFCRGSMYGYACQCRRRGNITRASSEQQWRACMRARARVCARVTHPHMKGKGDEGHETAENDVVAGSQSPEQVGPRHNELPASFLTRNRGRSDLVYPRPPSGLRFSIHITT